MKSNEVKERHSLKIRTLILHENLFLYTKQVYKTPLGN